MVNQSVMENANLFTFGGDFGGFSDEIIVNINFLGTFAAGFIRGINDNFF